jgi:hypothetical protein
VKVLGLAFAAVTLLSSAAPADAPTCARSYSRCSCARIEPSQLVQLFVRGDLDRVASRNGGFVEATLLRVRGVDASGRPLADRLGDASDHVVFEFAIVRKWSRPGGNSLADTVKFYAPRISQCPRPPREQGKRYLLFTYVAADTLRTWLDCQPNSASELPETQRAFRMLDSLLVRR